MGLTLVPCTVAAPVGKGAKAVLQQGKALRLNADQKQAIGDIVKRTVAAYNRTASEKRGQPGLAAELDRIRQASQQEALKLLTTRQRERWRSLTAPATSVTAKPGKADRGVAASLIIPTIEELKDPPRPGAFGPSTTLVATPPHAPLGDRYVILTDHLVPAVCEALERLAVHRGGEVISIASLGNLFKDEAEFRRVQGLLRDRRPRFVAIAPRIKSYRENMHLSMLKLLAGLDDDPQLDAFPGYLIAGDDAHLVQFIDRTIAFEPYGWTQLAPVSIGAIEDENGNRYRSYQKAKVMQRFFSEQGRESPAIIITTRKSHTQREDFPALEPAGGNIAMLPNSKRQLFSRFSPAAAEALSRNNLLFMFGHGTTGSIVGTRIPAFADIDFANELVFCGSCMSAAPYQSDRTDLSRKRGDKRFAFHAIDNGAVLMLGHMGLCGGFPKVFPMAELVLEGLSAGEAYQRLLNGLIGRGRIPPYSTPQRPSGNELLYILWGDPALVPVRRP